MNRPNAPRALSRKATVTAIVAVLGALASLYLPLLLG